jgi:diguanylate cyclase (GGDEF)-like protein
MQGTGRRWLFAIYLAVLCLGSALSFYVYQQGRSVRDATLSLTRQDMERLRSIADLKEAVLAREPILYRYYADVDRVEFRRAYADNGRRVSAGMAWIKTAFAGDLQFVELRRDQEHLNELASRLDQTLTDAPIDWDGARLVLAEVATVSVGLNARLNQLARSVENNVVQRGQAVAKSTEEMFYAVASVSILFFVLALFFGHYGYQHLLDARMRRSLALFPERNPNPVYRLTREGEVSLANPAAIRMQTLLKADQGQPRALLPPDLPARLFAMHEQGQQVYRFEYALEDRIISCTLQYLEDFDNFHAYLEDITARKAAERQNEFLAYHDPLTGLPNRRRFEDDATRLLTAESAGKTITVLLANIDRFRMVTQSLGHLAGDRLMCAVSARLGESLAGVGNSVQTTFYRLEGDRFAALVAGSDEPLSVRIGEHLHLALREPIEVDGRSLIPTLSIGLAHYPEHGSDFAHLFKNAESAMRRVREKGGDGLQVYHPEMNAHALDRLELAQELRLAAVRNELMLYYQPKVDLRDGRIVGMEALVRWNHPVRGLVAPVDFIPLAEETGSIVAIGEWILHTACAQNTAWQQAGLPPVVVAVNVSARQFNSSLPDLVGHILRATGLDPRWLELEITESVAMDSAESAIEIMQRLRALGVKLAIDDFGTGFSSLTYLKRFPIQTLKIDQSFVRQMDKDPTDRAIARGIVELGHSLGLEVIAEGVEATPHLTLLRDFGCDTMQGYLYSRPITPDAFEDLLRSGRRLDLPVIEASA